MIRAFFQIQTAPALQILAPAHVLVFRTDIRHPGELPQVRELFAAWSAVRRWTVDTDDADCVLRLECSAPLDPDLVIERLRGAGFACAELPD